VLAVAAVAALAAVGALLWWGYYRLSWTVPATSDGAAIALQAQDMLHGNWLLSGWTVGDVSFWTTELPEYALIELVRHLGTDVIHVAAATTYTLLVLLAGFLARGRARGREGVIRGLLASGMMLAPQLGYGAFVLLLSPDHTGTQVPLLLGWLILDLAPRRWWVPVLLGLLMASTVVSDRAAVLTAFEQVGGADRALEMGRDYALDRIAFGRPIGSFQAVKHILADMYVSATLARSNCYYGAWALSTNAGELPEAAAAARISATQAFQHCAKNNIQVHGGMGFTWEFDCHMYYRRANAVALGLGSLSYWEDALIDRMRKKNAA